MGLSLAAALVIVLPFFWYGSASGHDFEFHADSWFDAANQWKLGTMYPRWTAWANRGFGEPRFIFYPPLSWMLGAALTLILPVVWVPLCFVVLVQTLAGLTAYLLLRRLTGERAAILGAGFYAFNPNALLMSYVRSDFAEQLACAIFPLVLLGILRLVGWLGEAEQGHGSILGFAVPFAGVWLSNAPAGVIVSYSVALVIAWAAITQKSWKPVLRGAAGLALGFGLCGFYLIPAAYEQRWVNIGQALANGLLPGDNFLFTSIVDVEHTWFNWIASICALALIVGFLVVALGSRRFAARVGGAGVWGALLVLGGVATLLMMRFTLPLWMHLPKLRFVQFPWRWMSIVALAFACFAAAVFEKRRGWLAFVLLAALSVPLGHLLVINTWWDSDEMPTQAATITDESGFDGTDEYDPLGDDHADLPVDAPEAKVLTEDSETEIVKNATVKLLWWSAEKKELRVVTSEPARVALRMLNYPAWRVEVNGKQVMPERMDNFNQMVVPVGAGTSLIRVRFTRTADRSVGIAVTLVSLGIAGGLWVGRRKRGKI